MAQDLVQLVPPWIATPEIEVVEHEQRFRVSLRSRSSAFRFFAMAQEVQEFCHLHEVRRTLIWRR
jgi:hypothetical protein